MIKELLETIDKLDDPEIKIKILCEFIGELGGNIHQAGNVVGKTWGADGEESKASIACQQYKDDTKTLINKIIEIFRMESNKKS